MAGGAIGLGALAGCLGDDSADELGSWLVDPFYLPGRPERYSVFWMSPEAFDDHADDLPRDEWNSVEEDILQPYDFTRLFTDEIESLTQGQGGYRGAGFDVVSGDFDGEDIEDDVRRTDLRNQGEYEGYELFGGGETGWGIAIEDGTFVMAGGDPENDPVDVLYDIIDTEEGDSDPYHEVDSDFEAVFEATDPGDLAFYSTREPADETIIERGRFRNQIGRSFSVHLGSDETELQFTFAFLDERDVMERDIEDWTREDDSLRPVRDIEFDYDDEIAQVTGEVRTRDLFETL